MREFCHSRINSKNPITQGRILPGLIRFALPIMAANLLQVFYNAADMMIVSFSGEADAVGAIGTTLPILNLIVNSFIGISVGANVTMAQCVGTGDQKKAAKIVSSALFLSLLLGLFSAALGFFLSERVLIAMGTRQQLLTLSVRYAKIYFLGVPFLAITNFAAALIRAEGDSKRPLYILSLCGAVNVAANLFFVNVCGRNVDGVAIATVLSNALSAGLLTGQLLRSKHRSRPTITEFRPDRSIIGAVLRIGVPAGFQSALFSVSHLLIQSSILTVNNLLVPVGAAYQPVVGGCSASTNLESFANTVVNAIGQATITFVGQNAGAGNLRRIRKIRKNAYAFACIAAAVVGGSLLLFRRPLLALYGVAPGAVGSLENIAYESAEIRMFAMLSPYALLACMEVGSGILQGLAKPITATAASVFGSVVFRVLWIFTVFRASPTLTALFLSFPISWLLTSALHILFTAKTLSEKEAASGLPVQEKKER